MEESTPHQTKTGARRDVSRRAPERQLGLFFLFVADALSLRSRFGLALFIARLLVMLMFACILQDARQLNLLLEAFQRAVKRLVRSDLNLRQPISPLCVKRSKFGVSRVPPNADTPTQRTIIPCLTWGCQRPWSRHLIGCKRRKWFNRPKWSSDTVLGILERPNIGRFRPTDRSTADTAGERWPRPPPHASASPPPSDAG